MNSHGREEQYYTLISRLSFKLFITLLSLALLFSISCKSNKEPTKHPESPKHYIPKHELEGTWFGYDKGYHNYKLEFKVNSEVNITFSPKPAPDYDGSFYILTLGRLKPMLLFILILSKYIINILIRSLMNTKTKEHLHLVTHQIAKPITQG